MPTRAKEMRSARNQSIIDGFYEEGKSYEELSNEFGLSVSGVRKIIALDREHNGERERVETPSTCAISDRPISNAHAILGFRVDEFLRKTKMSPTDFGFQSNLSRQRVTALCRGVYDPTVSELQRIAQLVGAAPHELITPKEIRVAG